MSLWLGPEALTDEDDVRGLDVESLHTDACQPFADDLCGELGAMIRADVAQRSAIDEPLRKAIQDIVGSQAPGDIERREGKAGQFRDVQPGV